MAISLALHPAPAVRPTLARLTWVLACCAAAFRCAAAVESGHKPDQRDLDTLDISDVMPLTYWTGR